MMKASRHHRSAAPGKPAPSRRAPAGAGSAQRRASLAPPAFTLIELLVVVAVIAVLLAILVPSLSAARSQARQVLCAARLAELGRGWHMYAVDHRGRAMPLAYTDPDLIGAGPAVYWWGTNDAAGVDHTRGFVWPYLSAELRAAGLYECPDQPWGSYEPQGAAAAITSTYGYNGYYLSPPHTPGWSGQIRQRPWQMLDTLPMPGMLLALADAMIDLGADRPFNCALLDPPRLYAGAGRWTRNECPTTSFRHRGRANAVCADGHVDAFTPRGGELSSPGFRIGSIGAENDPFYVPDWREW